MGSYPNNIGFKHFGIHESQNSGSYCLIDYPSERDGEQNLSNTGRRQYEYNSSIVDLPIHNGSYFRENELSDKYMQSTLG